MTDSGKSKWIPERVSVLIPAYQAEKTISRTLHSLQQQTYSNSEAIIINDGSADKTQELLDAFSAGDKRIHAYYQENAGVAAARARALSLARGEWTLMMDADDCLPEDYLMLLTNRAKESGKNLILAGIRYVDEEGEDLGQIKRPPKGLAGADYIHRRLVKLSRQTTLASVFWNKLFKTEKIQDIEFITGRKYDDIFVMHRLADRFEEIAFEPRALYAYTQRSQSITHSQKPADRLDIVEAYLLRADYYHKNQAYSYMDYSLADAYYEYKRILAQKREKNSDKEKRIRKLYLSLLKKCSRDSRIRRINLKARIMLL